MEIMYFKEDVFQTLNISSQKEWKFLNECNCFSELANDPNVEDHQSPELVISLKKSREIERILETKGIEMHIYTWEQLRFKVDLKCLSCIMKRAIGIIDYHNYIALKEIRPIKK